MQTFYRKREQLTFNPRSLTNGSTFRFWEGSTFVKFKGVRTNKECLCEVIASNIGKSLGLPVLAYDLCNVDLQDNSVPFVGCCSENYVGAGDSVMSVAQIRDDLYGHKLEYYDCLCDMSGADLINKIIVFDYLIGNSDRHMGNIEYLVHSDGTIEMAPIFDSGLSLLCTYAMNKETWGLEQYENCFLNYGHRYGIFDVVLQKVTVNPIDWVSVFENVRSYITHEELAAIIGFVEYSKSVLKGRDILCENNTTS